jgi:hypothetical protein
MKDIFDELMEIVPQAPRRKKRKKTEAKVQKAIIRWLLDRGVVLAVTDAGMLKRVGLNMACGIPKGWPDLTGCLPNGRFLGVECKAPGAEETDEQANYRERFDARGGLCAVASSVEELVAAFRAEENVGRSTGIPIDALHV